MSLLNKCDLTTLVSEQYSAECMHKRNEYMVDSSDVLIAVWDGSVSGTGKTVAYARTKNTEVIIIDSRNL